MKVLISADMEGITGLVSWAQCSRPDGKSWDFPFARRMMSHDVNAAIRGARAAGATEVVVRDGHGNSKNLLIEDLEPGVTLVSGTGFGSTVGMVSGIDSDCAAVILVGYHAMAGTLHGTMEHTLTGGIHRLWLNGKETGEMGLSTYMAGEFGVPVVAVTSDDRGCAEAEALIPGVVTVAVKQGMGRYSSALLSPAETSGKIELGVATAVKAGTAKALRIEGPVELKVEYNRSEMADNCERHPLVERVDGYTVLARCRDYKEAHAVIWNLLDLESGGTASQF